MEALRRLRFAWALICIAAAIYVLVVRSSSPLLVIGVALLLFFPLYLHVRAHTKLALIWLGINGAALLTFGEPEWLIIGSVGAAVIWVLGWIVGGAFTRRSS